MGCVRARCLLEPKVNAPDVVNVVVRAAHEVKVAQLAGGVPLGHQPVERGAFDGCVPRGGRRRACRGPASMS